MRQTISHTRNAQSGSRRSVLPLLLFTIFVFSTFLMASCSRKEDDEGSSLLGLLSVPSGGNNIDATSQPIVIPEGETAQPGDPQVAPVLNDIIHITNAANPAEDPYSSKGLIQLPSNNSVTFQQPVHGGTVVAVFLGPRSMALLPDGTVINSQKSLIRTAANYSGHTFLVDSDRKFKVLVVAKNEFGISTKTFMTGHKRNCATALSLPNTVGNCGSYCLQAEAVGDQILVKVVRNIAGPTEYRYLDLAVTDPRLGTFNLAEFAFIEDFEGQSGSFEINRSFPKDTPYMCANVRSYEYFVEPFTQSILQAYVAIPDE